jgi:hypothetical protein
MSGSTYWVFLMTRESTTPSRDKKKKKVVALKR